MFRDAGAIQAVALDRVEFDLDELKWLRAVLSHRHHVHVPFEVSAPDEAVPENARACKCEIVVTAAADLRRRLVPIAQ